MPSQPGPEIPPAKSRAGPIIIISAASIATGLGLGIAQLFDPAASANLPDILGTVPSWLTGGGVLGILGLLIWWQLGLRKIDVEQIGIDNQDRADIRDHYAAEVAALRQRIDAQAQNHATRVADLERRYQENVSEAEARWRKAVRDVEERHEKCERELSLQAEKVRKLEKDYAGLERQILTQASDRVLALGAPGRPQPSDDVLAAAKRVKKIVSRRGKRRRADKRPEE